MSTPYLRGQQRQRKKYVVPSLGNKRGLYCSLFDNRQNI